MKKFSTLILSFVSVFLVTTAVPAYANTEIKPITISEKTEVKTEQFEKFEGTVVDITNSPEKPEVKYLLLENSEGDRTEFVITDSTYVLEGVQLKEGQNLIGFYEKFEFAIMIYPPQYPAVVIAPVDDKGLYIGKFNENYISLDNEIQLLGMDKADVVLRNGMKFSGKITDRRVAVVYSIVTKSIPGQTYPEKVIVLDYSDVIPIVVNDKVIDAPPIFITPNNDVMVPLRAVAEELGYTVTWYGESHRVTLSNTISLQLDKDYYTFAKMAPISLGVAPMVVKDRGYVPLSFFREVMQLNNAYLFEGQLVINNYEKME